MENKPNFIIVGAAKSGTTTLYRLLKQHPEIFMPLRKEPRFFVFSIADEVNTEFDLGLRFKQGTLADWYSYLELFRGVNGEKVIGEASTAYLYNYEVAIPSILKYLGRDVKIIIILRNPVDRAYSSYLHIKRMGDKSKSFEEALNLEEGRMKNKKGVTLYALKSAGMYYEQVKAYMENFPNVKVFTTDDLRKDSRSVIEELYKFLHVKTEFVPDLKKKYNQGYIARNEIARYFLRLLLNNRFFSRIIKGTFLEGILLKIFAKDPQEMNQKTKMELKEYFKKDILKLQKLIDKDLSSWL